MIDEILTRIAVLESRLQAMESEGASASNMWPQFAQHIPQDQITEADNGDSHYHYPPPGGGAEPYPNVPVWPVPDDVDDPAGDWHVELGYIYHFWWSADDEEYKVSSIDLGTAQDFPASGWVAVWVKRTINSDTSITLTSGLTTGSTETGVIEDSVADASGTVDIWVVATFSSDNIFHLRHGCDIYDTRVS